MYKLGRCNLAATPMLYSSISEVRSYSKLQYATVTILRDDDGPVGGEAMMGTHSSQKFDHSSVRGGRSTVKGLCEVQNFTSSVPDYDKTSLRVRT